MTLIKRIAAMAAVLLVGLLATAVVTPVRAEAAATSGVIVCDWSKIAWKQGGSTWGRAKDCGNSGAQVVQTDDILADGYCVHAEARTSLGWHYMSHSESCGAVAQSSYETGQFLEVRLVRGDPSGCIIDADCNGIGVNYFTIWP